MSIENKYKVFITVVLFFAIICSTIYIIFNHMNESNSSVNIMEEEIRDWIPVSEVEISDVPKWIIGYLSIPVLENDYYINMPIKEGTGINIMATSIGHFENTSYSSGNVCLVAHNSGTNKKGEYVGYFDKIKDLKIGDEIIFDNLSEINTYTVISNKIISEKDTSVLDNTKEDRLTLITCVKGIKNRSYRRCVVATLVPTT